MSQTCLTQLTHTPILYSPNLVGFLASGSLLVAIALKKVLSLSLSLLLSLCIMPLLGGVYGHVTQVTLVPGPGLMINIYHTVVL